MRDPFQILVGCILSLRTKDETTGPAAARLFALARTSRAMERLTPARIARAIYPVGFYRTKARTIRRLSGDLLERHRRNLAVAGDSRIQVVHIGTVMEAVMDLHRPGIDRRLVRSRHVGERGQGEGTRRLRNDRAQWRRQGGRGKPRAEAQHVSPRDSHGIAPCVVVLPDGDPSWLRPG